MYRNSRFRILSMVAVLCGAMASPLCSYGDDGWTQFRGPTGQGHAPDSSPPVEFSMEQAVIWKVPIEGKGWSSPVVANGKIWLTTAVTIEATPEETAAKLANDPLAGIKEVAGSVELKAVCIDFATGRTTHNISLAKFDDPEPINPLNTYASPTPVIDAGNVYCDFGNYGTWCLDVESGEIVWTKNVPVDYSVGPGSSPFIYEDKLILVCDGIDQQFVLALDKATGSELWRTPRPPMRADNVEYKKAYSTPIMVPVDGQMQLVVPTAQWICGYDPASGKEIWRADHGSGFSLSPRPILVGDLVVFSTGYMRPELVAVRPNGTGDVTSSHVVWRVSRGVPAKPSPISVEDRIFMISDDGILTQLQSSDGSIVWQERISGNFSASPVHAGGKLYLSSHEGTVSVISAGAEYQELAKNTLEPRILASPAVVGDDLLFRTEQSLIRIGM